MAQTVRLKVVTPHGSLIDQDAVSVTACSDVGEFCLLPEHRPLLASLSAGRLLVETTDGNNVIYLVDSGFFEGGMDHANVITQHCVSLSEVNVDSLKIEIEQLEEKLSKLSDDDSARVQLTSALKWARVCFDKVQPNHD